MVGQQQVRLGDASSEEPVPALLPQDTFVCLHASMHTELADQHDKLHLLRFAYIILILEHRQGKATNQEQMRLHWQHRGNRPSSDVASGFSCLKKGVDTVLLCLQQYHPSRSTLL